VDRKLSSEIIRNRKLSLSLKILAIICTISLLFFAFRLLIRPVIHLSEIKIAKVDQGNLEASVSASGVILPEFEEMITSPITSRILGVQHNVGETVTKGTILMLLDKTAEQLQLDRMKEELASKQNRLKKLQLTLEKTLIDLQTNFEIERLRSESLERSFENEKYIKNLGGSSQEMVKQAELNAKISRLEIDHLRQSIENQKASMKTDVKDLEFEINIHQRNMAENERRMESADIKAPGDGVITWINDKIGTTVSLGSELVKLADLKSFKAEATISEIYLMKLSTGGKVNLIINDSILTGKISAINPTVQNDAVKFSVQLDIKNQPLLRSNQRVEMYVITAFHNNIIRLARGEYNRGTGSPYVFVVKRDKALRTLVKFGDSNSDYTEIKEGLHPGDKVIISNLEDKMHYAEIKVKE